MTFGGYIFPSRLHRIRMVEQRLKSISYSVSVKNQSCDGFVYELKHPKMTFGTISC